MHWRPNSAATEPLKELTALPELLAGFEEGRFTTEKGKGKRDVKELGREKGRRGEEK